MIKKIKGLLKKPKNEKIEPFWLKNADKKINAIKKDIVMQAFMKKFNNISNESLKKMSEIERFNIISEFFNVINIIENKSKNNFKEYIGLAVKLSNEGFLSHEEFINLMKKLKN